MPNLDILGRPIWKITIFKSAGSRKSRDVFRNVEYVAANIALDSDDMATIVGNIVAAHRAGSTTEIHFLRVHITQVADNLLNQPEMAFRVVELSGVGIREVESAAIVGGVAVRVEAHMPFDTCLLVTKQTSLGRSGRVLLRGMLTRDDCAMGLDKHWTLVTNAPFVGPDKLIGLYNVALPDGANYALIGDHTATVTHSRTVTAHILAGIAQRQVTQGKTSIESSEREVVKRRLLDAYNKIHRLFKPGNLTWGTAAGQILAAANAAKKAAEEMWDALPAEDRAALLAGAEVAEVVTWLAIA